MNSEKQQRCSQQISVSGGHLFDSHALGYSGHAMEIGNACVRHWISVSGDILVSLRFGFPGGYVDSSQKGV